MKSTVTSTAFQSTIQKSTIQSTIATIGALAGIGVVAAPAFAHHAIDGKVPSNWIEGFVSGLAHPLIGVDHFAFVVAIGLLAVTKPRGVWLPVAFLVAALVGTMTHLLNIDLLAPELFIAGSVLVLGIMLVIQNRPNLLVLGGLATLAGVFHGYAYGESIMGAEMSPLLAYLLGFTGMQLAIAMSAFAIGRQIFHQPESLGLRYVGFMLCGAGVAFLSSVIAA